jgi:hypothetical protein
MAAPAPQATAAALRSDVESRDSDLAAAESRRAAKAAATASALERERALAASARKQADEAAAGLLAAEGRLSELERERNQLWSEREALAEELAVGAAMRSLES